jgi:tRNA threonylcarbamoyladenosine biosynthesis protein TsaB
MMPAKSSEPSPETCLTLDTALAACTVGIVQGTRLLAGRQELRARGHAERLIPMVEEVLAEAQMPVITAVVATLGPGSFTGLRVALAAAEAFGLAWNCPVYGVSTLDAVAFAHRSETPKKLLISHDAGRRQCYAQLFDPDALPLSDMRTLGPDEVAHWAETENAMLAGSANSQDPAAFPAPLAMAAMVAAGRNWAARTPIYSTSWTFAA